MRARVVLFASLLTVFAVLDLRGAAPPMTAAAKAQKERSINKTIREVAGSAEYLRSVPKRWATLTAVDAAGRRVTVHVEGEAKAKGWPLALDAEVKVFGWWGRLDQFVLGDRVWVWFQTNRKGAPIAVAMLADEISEQDIHDEGPKVVRAGDGALVVKVDARERTLKTAGAEKVRPGARIYLQSAGDRARLVLDPAAFEAKREQQKSALRKRWADEGLPGSVAFVHRFSGEMDLMLDHEAMRWARSLKLGDKVTVQADPPFPAVVKSAHPWRERTQVRLVARSSHLTDLLPGQRLGLRMPAPPAELEKALLPPDLDRPRSKAERIEWFLASIYCTCGVRGDVCTGHFYTLSSCNPNGCGMPRATRRDIGELLDKGLTDKQVFEALLKEHGPKLLRPHLLR
jgi:hypothetical protein